MGVEFEVKYRATPQAQAQIFAAFAGDFQKIEMETTYYDTPDGALSQRWYTLRRRLENGVGVCTLKTPEKGLGRGEYDLPCEDISAALPQLQAQSGIEDLLQLTAGGLQQVCGAKFTRLAKTVVMPDCTVEIALDEGVLQGGDKQMPLCEVEVELKAGSREAVMAYANALALRFGLIPEKGSKFRRALALAKGE